MNTTRIGAGLGVCLLAILLAGGLLSFELFVPKPLAGSITFEVQEGSSVKQVSNQLADKGLVGSAFLFSAYYSLFFTEQSIKTGEYTLTRPLDIPGLANLIARGSPKKERTITVIEGWTSRQIGDYLEAQGVVSRQDFLRAVSNKGLAKSFEIDIPPDQTLDGFLFPDTYRIFERSTADQIVEKMLNQFSIEYRTAIQEGSIQKPAYETVILASILEREVKGAKDRALVADLLYRRLSIGMPLQVDSTVNYVTGKNDPSVRFQDLAIDSPYNTYKYRGLPPSPISNPGLSSLKAAMRPEPNPYWFFLTTPDGRVIYSKTFEGHVKNKRKYL